MAVQIIYVVLCAACILLCVLREMHMLQLNSYQFRSHFTWMRKNLVHYLPQLLLLAVACSLLTGLTAFRILTPLLLLPAALSNLPRKAKKPLVYTARVKRMLVTFGLLAAACLTAACLLGGNWGLLLCMGTAALTPLLLVLANAVNAPVEAAVRQYYVQDAKRMLRAMPELHIVGITGSYGKTSMKFYLSSILQSQKNVLMTPESYNTPMGVVKTIRTQLRPTHEYFICEMGARRVRQIRELCRIVHPQDGILTSIGPQHLETFHSIDAIVSTKFELADALPAGGRIFLNGDNEYIRERLSKYPNAITYGLQPGSDYSVSDLEVSFRGTRFTVHAPSGEACTFTTTLLGEHSVLNMLGAIAYCHAIGIPLEKLVLPVKRVAPVPHRLQLIESGGINFIDDAYNSNFSGCKAALGALGLFDCYKILVTPGMVELGAQQEPLNFAFGQEAAKVCDFVVLVGRKQTEPIYKGLRDADYPEAQIYIADTLQDGLQKIHALQTDQKKIVLLENDLPDNY